MPNPSTHTHLEACASLLAEHRQMEVLLDRLSQACQQLPDGETLTQHQYHELTSVMGSITRDMNIHFACEEQVLFPAVEPYHPMVLMEVEHEEIMAIRNGILQCLDGDTLLPEKVAEVKTLAHRLVEELLNHIGREDGGIFPTCEQSLSTDEKERVIAGMEQLRQKAHEGDIPEFTRPPRTFTAMAPEVNAGLPLSRSVMVSSLGDHGPAQFKYLRVRAGDALADHWTPQSLTVVGLEGNGVFVSGDKRVPIHPHTVIYLDPQLRHAVEATTDLHLLLIKHDTN